MEKFKNILLVGHFNSLVSNTLFKNSAESESAESCWQRTSQADCYQKSTAFVYYICEQVYPHRGEIEHPEGNEQKLWITSNTGLPF